MGPYSVYGAYALLSFVCLRIPHTYEHGVQEVGGSSPLAGSTNPALVAGSVRPLPDGRPPRSLQCY